MASETFITCNQPGHSLGTAKAGLIIIVENFHFLQVPDNITAIRFAAIEHHHFPAQFVTCTKSVIRAYASSLSKHQLRE